MSNPLVRDRNVDFLLYEIFAVEELTKLPHYADHSKDTFDMYLGAVRRYARDVLYPTYRSMDQEMPVFKDGRVITHPKFRELYAQLAEMGVITATRPSEVGGAALPLTVAAIASTYLIAANLGVYGATALTAGAGHLLEAFGNDFLKEAFMSKLYGGVWSGTMALTEPHAGSSLADVRTTAAVMPDGRYKIRGNKMFISGADNTFVDNVVQMTLARIEGAPAGTKGVSLFAVPSRRPQNADGTGELVSNDVAVSGMIHKMGWRAFPSLALNYGENDDCVGWLVGEPNRGLSYMFQMMNEARIFVGASAVATASVAFEESLDYARTRLQGRAVMAKDPTSPQVPIMEHADVRRMLLRQKAIVEGGLALVGLTARYADVAEHGDTPESRERAQVLFDLMTPLCKTFPAERGFESNALAVQIHGGYGYTSEYLPEAWLRDQKINTIHEGTSGIQSLDLLGRKVMATGGRSLALLQEAISATTSEARAHEGLKKHADALDGAMGKIAAVTSELGQRGLAGNVDSMLAHSYDYLDMTMTLVTAWLWLRQAYVATRALENASPHDRDFYRGKLQTTDYWFANELPRLDVLGRACLEDESYLRMRDAWF